ncbi:MAG: 50S ribosomal protein L35 [Candidatus Harrisonbacteria bacterium]|nr:50S ribosomal protein L35 [Candidatus Harrisonbacteria bacterium]
MVKNSISSRIKVTKTGKLMRRKMGQGHFRAKKSGTVLNRNSGKLELHASDKKVLIKKYGL